MPPAPKETSQERLCVSCRRVKQIQEGQLFFRGKEGRFEGVSRQFSQVLVGKSEQLLGQLVFPGQRCTKHCRIVSVECDHNSPVKVLTNGMSVERRARARAQIAGKTYLHRDLP